MVVNTTTFIDRNQAADVDYTPSGGSASTLATMTYDAGMRETLRELGNGLRKKGRESFLRKSTPIDD